MTRPGAACLDAGQDRGDRGCDVASRCGVPFPARDARLARSLNGRKQVTEIPMIKIYGTYRSRATRPLWLLAETGTPHELVPVVQAYRLADPKAADAPLNTLSPDWLDRNPAGGIPALEDDGVFMTESLGMNLWLAKRYGGELGPWDASEEARMLQWSFYAATSVEPHTMAILSVGMAGKGDTDEGRAAIAAACDLLRRPLAAMESHLARAGHLVGNRFTVADINMAECLRYAQSEAALIAEFPAVKTWLEACQARPAFKEVMARRAAEPA